jgi:hypothetical protein
VTKKMFKALFLVTVALTAVQQANAQNLCDRISEIKVLPFKSEHINDAAYNALIEAGDSVLPCLIAKVADTRRMRDPRQAPTYPDIRVGDVAYFVLVHIAKIGFVEMFPAKVQENYKAEGVYAYFEFVRKKRNRMWLQRRLNEWYRTIYEARAQHNNSLNRTRNKLASYQLH